MIAYLSRQWAKLGEKVCKAFEAVCDWIDRE